jgi:ubiquinol oxidase
LLLLLLLLLLEHHYHNCESSVSIAANSVSLLFLPEMKKTNPLLLAGATVLLCACLVVVEIDKAVALIVVPSSKHHNPNRRQTNDYRTDDDSNPITSRKTTTTAVFSATHSDGSSNSHLTHPKDEPGAAGTRNEERNRDHISQTPEQEQYRPQALPLAPMELEEKLLGKHDALESFISKSGVDVDGGRTITQPPEGQPHGLVSPNRSKSKSKNVELSTSSSFSSRSIPYFLRPVPYFLQSRGEEQQREISAKANRTTDTILVENQRRASINRAVNDFDNNDTALEEDLRRASIDRAIYAFNKNLVDILYEAISYFYPTSSPSKQSDPRTTTTTTSVGVISPLLGTEYNEALAPSQQNTKEHLRVLRFEKFYVFETVARIPYFAYLSVLHLRETLGDKRSPFADRSKNNNNESKLQNHHYCKRIEKMRTHYAQADNEVHHLLIMEELGGNARGVDRLLAHSMAFCYYWFVVLVFFWNEQAAYHLNEVVEDHAYKIYEEFLTLYEDELRALPVPEIARKYYEVDYQNNPHLFETFCAVAKCQEGDSKILSSRKDNRPHELHTLYDVFRNIRDDEKEHWMALCNLVQYDDIGGVDETNVQSTKKEGTADTIP